MTIIPRLLPSVQFSRAQGSISQRNRAVREICDGFSDWLVSQQRQKTMSSTPRITAKEVGKVFRQMYEGVFIKIGSAVGKNSAGGVDFVVSHQNKAISAMTFAAKTFNNACNAFSALHYMVLGHENYHLASDLCNPKVLAREAELELKYPKTTKKYKKINDFYENALYSSSLDGIDKSVPTNLRKQNIKKHVTAFFAKEGFSSNDKILILQTWRNNLLSEVGAYKEGARVSTRILNEFLYVPSIMGGKCRIDDTHAINFAKIPTLKRDKAKDDFVADVVSGIVFDSKEDGFHEEKYKLLNEMLKDEIKSHRTAHADALRQN